VVDRTVLAAKLAAVRDAVARIREVLPASFEAFERDRTAREVVLLNLFVALQECTALAAHWLSDEGLAVPPTYRETFASLAEKGVVDADLAARLGSAAGLRNLIAHRYGAVEWGRIHRVATSELDDLIRFCEKIAQNVDASS
jgi:uncharacterized protein YutE (UPF0331/DUF86 family)